MASRIGGFRRKTRSLMKKSIKTRGKLSIRSYFQKFKERDKVYLVADPGVHKGMYFPRFHNKAGEVKGKRGSCYEIIIKDGKVKKTIIVHPIHLKKNVGN